MSKNSENESRKRQASDVINQIGWNIMKRMGYSHGEGLGVDSQGRVDAIKVELRKDRRGLGMTSNGITQETDGGTLLNCGPNRWPTEQDQALSSSDLIWRWKRWWLLSELGEGAADSLARKQTVIDNAISRLGLLILPPTSPDAKGSPITEMSQQTMFCPSNLLCELFTYKDALDGITQLQLLNARMRSNPFEDVKNGIFMNRAAMKMANLDSLLNGLFTSVISTNEILHFADVCAGPGGFSEYLLWRRCNAPFDSSPPTLPAGSRILPVKGHGFTRVGDCDFNLSQLIAGPVEAFAPHYGVDKSGDITNWPNLASFANWVHQSTHGQGVHIVTADGGFDVTGKENLQEPISKRLYLCQCLCALSILRPGGHFVMKMFDVFTEFSAGLVYLISHVFEEILFIKPVTSRPANSERYLVCKGLISPNSYMAGCPLAPTDRSSKAQPARAMRQPTHKLPGSKKRPSSPIDVSSCRTSGPTQTSNEPIFDSSTPVATLIVHFLQINTALGSRNVSENTPDDILQVCKRDYLLEDEGFVQFLTKMNIENAQRQCIYLSKLLQFSEDATLTDPHTDLKDTLIQSWKIPLISRQLLPWTLWHDNLPDLLQGFVKDSSKGMTLPWLPSVLTRPEHVPDFGSADLQRRDFTPDNLLGLVCGSPCSTIKTELSHPMTVYSMGSYSKNANIQITFDGRNWELLSGKFQNLFPHLPAASIVWAQATYEYNDKTHLRKHALTIIDVAFLYGHDLRELSYRERMNLARDMASTVNFPGIDGSNIVVPSLLPLREIQHFIEQLPIKKCKDKADLVPMISTSEGYSAVPTTLYLATHLKEPWVEIKSNSTGKYYYFNRFTLASIYDLPKEVLLSYDKTLFFKLKWSAPSIEEYDAVQLALEVIHLDF